MKALRTIRNELYKNSFNMGYVLAVLIVTLLAFTGQAYHDPVHGKVYSVLEAAYSFGAEFKNSEYILSRNYILSAGLNGYITMFIPVVCAFPVIVSFGAQKNGGYIRFEIARSRAAGYWVCRFFAAVVCAGMSVVLGMLLYELLLLFMFPATAVSMFEGMGEELTAMLYRPPVQVIANVLLASFIYGMVSVLPALILSVFSSNPYVTTCIPFVLCYVWKSIMDKEISSLVIDMKTEASDVLQAFTPDAPSKLYIIGGPGSTGNYTLLAVAIYLLAALIIYVTGMCLHTDRGR